MNFEDEPYVRVYTRKTPTFILMGWEGRTVLWHLMLEVDRAGVLELGELSALEAIVCLTQVPTEVVEAGLARLLKLGVLRLAADRLVIARFIEAQEALRSDRARARDSRERRRDKAENITPRDGAVTPREVGVTRIDVRHTTSHDVTLSSADQIRSEIPPLVPPEGGQPSEPRSEPRLKTKRRTSLPESWAPNAQHGKLALELGVSVTAEVENFRDYCASNAKTYADWDAGFRNWLRNARRFARPGPRQPPKQPDAGVSVMGKFKVGMQ